MASLEEQTISVQPLQSAFCRELRSKKYFSLQSIPISRDDYLDASNHCWCRLTMQVVGPDGEMVHPNACRNGRSCYKSQFE